jgi:hypothetical protein
MDPEGGGGGGGPCSMCCLPCAEPGLAPGTYSYVWRVSMDKMMERIFH